MKWLYYLLFAILSSATVTIAGEVLIIEVIVLFVLLGYLLQGVKPAYIKKITLLDKLVVAFAILSVFSVVAGSYNLWDSARYFRHHVLTPTLLYFSFRLLPLTPELFRKGMLFFVPIVFVQALLLIRGYLLYGGRQQFFEGSLIYTITLAAMFVFALSITLFFMKDNKSKTGLMVLVTVFVVLLAGLYFSFSRTSLGGFILLVPLSIYVWKRPALVKLSGRIVFGVVAFFMFLLTTSAVVYEDSGLNREQQSEIQHSSKRLFSAEILLQDMTGRFDMWGRHMNKIMDRPLSGWGGAGYATNINGQHIASSHNMIISVLLVSGIPGFLLFLFMITSVYKCFHAISFKKGLVFVQGKILWVSFSALLMVGFTGGLGGGRILLMYAMMGMIARLSLFKDSEDGVPQHVQPASHVNYKHPILRMKR